MDNIEYIAGGSEMIDFVKPLWERLKDHHRLHSQHFSNQYTELTFEKRKSKLLLPSTTHVKIDLVKITGRNEYIGYCISTINAEHTGEVDSLYLESEYRKMGIGNELMTRALNWMDEKQVKTKVISVGEGNEAVFNFYQHFGFYKRRTILVQIKP